MKRKTMKRKKINVIIKVIIFLGIFLSAICGSLACSKRYNMNHWFVRPISDFEMTMNAIMIGIFVFVSSIIVYSIGYLIITLKRKITKK